MFSVRRAATVVAALTAASTALGFGRDVVIASVFGASADLDSYFVAQGLMNVVLGLVAGAMAKASVPVLAREAAAETARCRGHRSVDVALSLTVIVLGLAGLVMWLVARPVVGVLAPGFAGQQADLTVTLTRVVLVATVLIAGTNLLAAVVQTHGRFGWSAIQGVPFNLVMIVVAAVAGPTHGVLALAWGFVAGSLARLLVHVVPLRRIGTRLRVSLDVRDQGFREIARLVPALLLGSAVGNVNTLVDRAVGSTLAEGTISALSYGWRLVSLGEVLLVASLLTALYPALGAAASDRVELRRLVGRGLSVTVVLLTPVAIALMCAASPIVTVAFARGNFGAADVRATSLAVLWYAPALLALGWRELVVRASYAVGDSRGPVIVAVLAMIVNVVGDLTAGRAFGIPGLAASTTGALLLAAALNSWLLHRRHGALPTASVAGLALRSLAAGLLAAAAGMLTVWMFEDALVASTWVALRNAAAVSLVVVAVYGLGLLGLKAPEGRIVVDHVVQLVRRR